jgi:superfamily II DNA or RNA helicase
MGVALKRATAREVRAAIAAALAGDRSRGSVLGDIILQPHQREAVTRIEAAMSEFGGALLADATGLGKTYVALAVARDARDALIVAPAALREMWRAAMNAAGRAIPFLSIESLGRRRADVDETGPRPDFVIVDEAHHVRNPATARYRSLAALTSRARVLLLSATPIHNSEEDLHALLGLFLGARAAGLDVNTAMRCIVRRSEVETNAHLPRVGPPRRLEIPDDEARMHAIVALPPPIPPADGGDGGILLVYSLLRRWASSQGALAESLRRRLARASALIDALEIGRYPSSRELSAWSYADGAVQLAFPELTVSAQSETMPADSLMAAVRIHATAVRLLLDELGMGPNVDEQRAAHLDAVRAAHPNAKIIAFTQFAETVAALYGQLRRKEGVAALTADGARVAGGALSRSEALARFAPNAQRCAPVGRAHAIDLVLTTDLLSEGVNLQDASVVVHLDLPWTPARLEQRVGRAARIGSRHDHVVVYAMEPPASAERLVRVEDRLRSKLGVSARSVGIAGTILPHLFTGDPQSSPANPPEWGERLSRLAASWADPALKSPTIPIVAAVVARTEGFLAAVDVGGTLRVIAAFDSEATDDPATILRAFHDAGGADADVVPANLERAVDTIRRWQATHRERREITLEGALHARSRRAVVRRIAAIAHRAPRHRRSDIVALAAAARHTVTARYGAGAEHVLDALAAAAMPDEAWLRAIGAFGAIHDRPPPGAGPHEAHYGPAALLLLVALPDAET